MLLDHECEHEDQPPYAQYQEDDKERVDEVAHVVHGAGQREVGLHGIVLLALVDFGHEHLLALVQILRNGDEAVAAGLQGVDDAGQGFEGLLAGGAAGIVQQDDVAVAVFHTFYHAAVDLVGRHTRFPVLGVDALAHVEIVLFARLYQRQ